MADEAEVETTDTEEATEETEEQEEQAEDPTEGLKKALTAERKLRKAAERRASDAEAERASADKTADEQAIDKARREAAAEATKAANGRLLKAEIRAAAKGRLADPADALAYLDLDDFEVGEDGEIDSESIEDAISDLLTRKPYLAGESKKFGSADQGAKGRQTKPSQMTRAEFNQIKDNPHAVMKAKEEGRLNTLLGIET